MKYRTFTQNKAKYMGGKCTWKIIFFKLYSHLSFLISFNDQASEMLQSCSPVYYLNFRDILI